MDIRSTPWHNADALVRDIVREPTRSFEGRTSRAMLSGTMHTGTPEKQGIIDCELRNIDNLFTIHHHLLSSFSLVRGKVRARPLLVHKLDRYSCFLEGANEKLLEDINSMQEKSHAKSQRCPSQMNS